MALFGAFGLLGLGTLIFTRKYIGVISAVCYLFILYSPKIFEGGNYTEEYGAYCLIGGMLMVALLCRVSKHHAFYWFERSAAAPKSNPRKNLWNAAILLISGMAALFFALAPLYKEVFVLSIVPWLGYVLWYVRTPFRKAVICVMVIVPIALCGLYLLWNRALWEWLDVFSYNFANVDLVKQSFFQKILANYDIFRYRVVDRSLVLYILALIGGASQLFEWFHTRRLYFGMIVTLSFGGSYLATALSGRGYGHYYLQLVPCYAILIGYGIQALRDIPPRISGRLRVNYQWILFGVLAGLLLCHDRPRIMEWFQTLTQPYQPYRVAEISDVVTQARQADGRAEFTIWAPQSDFTWLYYETGLLSPYKHHVFFNHFLLDSWLSTRDEKIEALRTALAAHRPTMFICTPDRETEIVEFFLNHFGASYAYQSRQFGEREVFFFLLREARSGE